MKHPRLAAFLLAVLPALALAQDPIPAPPVVRVPKPGSWAECGGVRSVTRTASTSEITAEERNSTSGGDPSLQAVDICTPSGTHSALGCAAARSGKNVLVEKPIDVSLAAADSLIEACERAGVCLGVSLQSRFLDAPRILKAAVDTGRFGTPVAASAYIKWYRTPDYYRSAAWRGSPSTPSPSRRTRPATVRLKGGRSLKLRPEIPGG